MANSLLSRLYLHPCSRRGMRALMSSADFNVCLAAESLTRRGLSLMSIQISERRDELAVLEDHQLVALVRTRDGNFQDAAVVLTKRLNGFLTSMICSVSHFQADDLADVIQQTWIRAFSPGTEQFSTAPEFRSWLKTVASTCCSGISVTLRARRFLNHCRKNLLRSEVVLSSFRPGVSSGIVPLQQTVTVFSWQKQMVSFSIL